jgi:prepilin-type N-terminal cleavage/methylation domain-containing protein
MKAVKFTLVELLVVVAVIGVLVSLLMPALAAARERAKSIKCLGNVRQIGLGAIAYATDSDGWTPAPFSSAQSPNYWSAIFFTQKYVQSTDCMLCPSSSSPAAYSLSNPAYSYGINRDVTKEHASETYQDATNIFKNVKIAKPSMTWYFGDSVGLGWWSKLKQCYMISWNNGTKFNLAVRHGPATNLWMLDGSAHNMTRSLLKSSVYPGFQQYYIGDTKIVDI